MVLGRAPVHGSRYHLHRHLSSAPDRSERASSQQITGFTRQFEEERLTRYRGAILIAVRDNQEIPRGAGNTLNSYFETMAGLCRSGHYDTRLLWSIFGPVATLWWAVLRPYTQRIRAEQGGFIGSDFDWLASVLLRMDRRAGIDSAIDPASVANWLAAGAIEGLQERIRVEEALRSVTIAPSGGLDSAQPAAAAPAPAPSPSLTAENEQEHQSG